MKRHQLTDTLKVLVLFVFTLILIKVFITGRSNTQAAYRVVYTRARIPHIEPESVLSTADKSLRAIIKCENRAPRAVNISTGQFFILKNYIVASRHFSCNNSITYVTHSDFTFIDNVVPLLKRWNGPLSVAVYAPGDDFPATLEAIFYLRYCHEFSPLVRQLATFHIFFDEFLLKDTKITHTPTDCIESEKFLSIPRNETFRARHDLIYPINTARNVARAEATTHFVLVSDIELYPNPEFIKEFFEMIVYHADLLDERNVFVVPIFEIAKGEDLPRSKFQLRQLFIASKLQWFHMQICAFCHIIPMPESWLAETSRRAYIHTTVKRYAAFSHWEPIFVGTNADPFYDERLSWEGKSDKMTQAYVMCLLDYNFSVLSRGFLIHRPGIKSVEEATRVDAQARNHKIVAETIMPEIGFLYGENEKCQMYT